jgi:hypothetical protein
LEILTGGSINLSLFTLLLECHFTHVHDRGGTLVHAELFFAGEAKNVKSFLHGTVQGINTYQMKVNKSNTQMMITIIFNQHSGFECFAPTHACTYICYFHFFDIINAINT